MAFAAVGALIAGAEATAALVLGAAAEIGAAMSVVGTVTKSKELMKIGAVLGLVGGVGSAIAGATGAAAGTAATGLSEAATSSALDAASSEALSFGGSQAAFDATTDSLLADLAPQAGGGIVQGAAELGTDLAGQAASVGDATQAVDLTQSSAAATTPTADTVNSLNTPADRGVVSPLDQTGNTVRSPYDVGGANGPDNIDVGGGFSPTTAPRKAGTFWSDFSSWAEKNKTLVNGGMQLIGGALKGANDRQMWDERMALERDRMARSNTTANFAPGGIVMGAR